MKIILKIYTGEIVDGKEVTKEKTYISPPARGRMVRRAIEITEEVGFANLKTADLDILVDYAVKLFNNQFTIDEFYDGIDAEQLLPTVMDCVNNVVGTIGAKVEQFPNVQGVAKA